MDWQHQCAIVLPCLDEQDRIGNVVVGARRFVSTVIVVDDGSKDATARRAAEATAVVVSHGANKGKGAALTSGFRRARELGFSWALAMDGDGQHASHDIPRFFQRADETSAALVVGDRMHSAEKIPWLRRRVNVWMSSRISELAGQRVPDSQCGFRLVNLDAWQAMAFHTTRFEYESEMFLRFGRAGFRIESVPVEVIYKHERSKIRPLLDSIRWLRWYSSVRRSANAPASKAFQLVTPAPQRVDPRTHA